MTLIKNLGMNIVKKNIGFTRREDLDFTDDGNRFRGFEYKGLPITTLRADDTTYLCLREDYLDNNFTWKEWGATEESRLCDEFNGVSEIDLDKLVENCERVLAKINELNNAVEDVDMNEVLFRAEMEIAYAKDYINRAKHFRWWDMGDYTLRSARDAMKGLQHDIDRLDSIMKRVKDGSMARQDRARYAECLNDYGYVVLGKDDFYLEQVRELEKEFA